MKHQKQQRGNELQFCHQEPEQQQHQAGIQLSKYHAHASLDTILLCAAFCYQFITTCVCCEIPHSDVSIFITSNNFTLIWMKCNTINSSFTLIITLITRSTTEKLTNTNISNRNHATNKEEDELTVVVPNVLYKIIIKRIQ